MGAAGTKTVFLSHSNRDESLARQIVHALERNGIEVWRVETSVPLGANWKESTHRALAEVDAFLLIVSQASFGSEYLQEQEWPMMQDLAAVRRVPLVPVFEPGMAWAKVPSWIAERMGVVWRDDFDARRLVEGLVQLLEDRGEGGCVDVQAALAGSRPEPAIASGSSLNIRRIEIEGIRCLESVTLDVEKQGVVFLGENASGKSTLLRAIVLGLCDESEASALLHELPGQLIRRGREEARIVLHLARPNETETFQIVTRILRERDSEVVRKETTPNPFPWDDLFVCGYGTNRGRQATASHDAYSTREAVRTLFDDAASLQNPEVILLRQGNGLRRILEQRLLEALMLDEGTYGIAYPDSGPSIRGPWGEQPIKVLSDGYRSTLQWILDVYAWAIYAGRLASDGSIGGILLLDEIEQHLHPRWQREILARLRRQFPDTQIFATTHTPLVAAGAADSDDAALIRLKIGEGGKVSPVRIDPEEIRGKRADQVLTSEAFGLLTTRSPGTQDDLDRWTELHAKAERSEAEESELAALDEKIHAEYKSGETPYQQAVQTAVDEALAKLAGDFDPKRLELEKLRQLKAVFEPEESEA